MRRAVLTRRSLVATAGMMAVPAVGRAQDAPAAGRAQDAPAVGRAQDAPAAGRAQDAPAAGRAQDAPAALVIGVLTDQTGIGESVSGPPLVQAVQMAVQDTGALPEGRPLSVVTESYQLKPDDALVIARRLFDQGVSVIVDVPGSAAAVAVQALARSRGRSTLVTGSVNPTLTSRDCSPFGSSWGTDSASMTAALVRAMARTGAKTWFLVVPDTILGLAVRSDAVRAIEQSGGQVLGQSRHPAEATDFASIVTQAKDCGARAIGLCDITRGLTDQLRQFQTGGLFENGRSVVAFLPAITDIHAAGAKAAHGLILASPFYWNQNDQARSFASRFIAATGRMPDAAHAAAYIAVYHYLRAVIATQSLDASLINQEMRRTPIYFFGRSARLRLDGRLAVDLALLRVKPEEAMQDKWDHYEQIGLIRAADIYRPLNQTGCTLAP
jgi:branched-chain amino acid transport system substrate-binding protein